MEKLESLREYIWKYFEFHASQRTLLLRFYITISSLLITGLSYLLLHFNKKSSFEINSALIVSIMLLAISWIFRNLVNPQKSHPPRHFY